MSERMELYAVNVLYTIIKIILINHHVLNVVVMFLILTPLVFDNVHPELVNLFTIKFLFN